MRTLWDKNVKLKNSKRDRKSLRQDVKKYINRWFYVYCEDTSLHGFRYIRMSGSTMIESAFWSVVCVLAIIFCIILMLRLWDNYSNNPIVTIVDTTNPIWYLPFPSVTICNNNKVYLPQADIITKRLYTNGFSIDESDHFFQSLTKLTHYDKSLIDNVTANKIFDSLGVTVEELMKQLMQPCSALLIKCIWTGQVRDCNRIFKMVKSREGFCCAFNFHFDNFNISQFIDYGLNERMLDSNFIHSDMFSEALPGVGKILRSPGSGQDMGLAVAINVERHLYKATSRPYVGASVMIHDPLNFPDIGVHSMSVLPGHVLKISVAGTFVKSKESLRHLPIEKRMCYLDDEIPGEIHYSYPSCVSKCIAENVRQLCGCLPFYYPKKHEGVRTCYLPDLDCLLSIRRSPDYWEMGTCKECLHQCSGIIYHTSAQHIKMDDVKFNSELTDGLDRNNMSLVFVSFGDRSYVEYRKQSIVSWDLLLASFGGIFGLCLGGSMMSIIELVYLLAKQFFMRQFRKKCPRNLPPASELFLSNSVKSRKVQLQKPQSYEKSNVKRVFIAWSQPEAKDFGNIFSIPSSLKKLPQLSPPDR